MGFDWQTEEEGGELDPSGQRPPQPTPQHRRHWPWILLSLILGAAAIVVIWRQLGERVNVATETIEEEILASHALARRAATAKDEEIFASIVSGTSKTWVEAQNDRLHNGLLFENSLRPFGFRPLAQPSAELEVTVNPALSQAVVQVRRPFAVDAGGDLTTTIHLTQTYLYKYKEDTQRWLLAPPEAEFWGPRRTVEGNLVTLITPARERELATRMTADIDRKLTEMCQKIVDCPPAFHVRVRLETEPASVQAAANAVKGLREEQTLTLPAPTLLGRPTDDKSYEALYRAYARHVVAAAMTTLTEYQCCNGLLFYQALLNLQLAQLDLRAPPLASGEHRHLLDISPSMRHLEDLWGREALPAESHAVPPEIYTLLEFLQQRIGGSVNSLHRLQHTLDATFWEWLTSHGWDLSRTQFEERWIKFVQDSIQEGQEEASWHQDLTLPDQDLLALCGNELQDLYRHDLRREQWSMEAELGFSSGLFDPLPADEGYIVTGQLSAPGAEPRNTTLLSWQEAETLTISGDGRSGPLLLPWEISEPSGQHSVALLLQNTENLDWDHPAGLLASILESARRTREAPPVALLDPASCSVEACNLEALSGIPIWSPDGSQKVTLEFFLDPVDGFEGINILYPADKSKQRLIGGAVWPFWLDNETFGFVGAGRGPRHPVVQITNVRTYETSTLFTADDVLLAIPEERQPATLPPTVKFTALLAHPTDPNSIVALAAPHTGHGERFLMEIRRPNEGEAWVDVEPEVDLLEGFSGLIQEDWRAAPYSLSLDGRWLTLEVKDNNGQEGAGLLIYDLQERQMVLASAAPADNDSFQHNGDWSRDGVWFARTVPQRIDLIAPAVTVDGHPGRHAIFHEFEQCTSVAWVNR